MPKLVTRCPCGWVTGTSFSAPKTSPKSTRVFITFAITSPRSPSRIFFCSSVSCILYSIFPPLRARYATRYCTIVLSHIPRAVSRPDFAAKRCGHIPKRHFGSDCVFDPTARQGTETFHFANAHCLRPCIRQAQDIKTQNRRFRRKRRFNKSKRTIKTLICLFRRFLPHSARLPRRRGNICPRLSFRHIPQSAPRRPP